MKINIKARHVSITPALKEYAQKKFERIEKFFEKIQEIDVELDHSDTADENARHIASVTIWASGTILKAHEASNDMYASIDICLDKAEKQLKKHKEKLQSYRRAAHKRTLEFNHPSSKHEKQDDDEHEKLYIEKPMMPEDAAGLLEMEKLQFLVFKNIETNSINVIYPLKNGQFGLIET